MNDNEKTLTISSLPPLLSRVRAQRPLVHHITNMVVMNDTANATLAVGASPVMAHALEEVEEMVDLASVLLLNIETLTPAQIEAMLRAGRRASARGIPIVLDPVGVGATTLRTESALRLLRELPISAIRGNASEVGTLVGVAAETRGVDSVSLSEDREVVARRAAREFRCCVAITGARDLISDGERIAYAENGHPLLASITGSGCMATTIVAAFLAVETDAWRAATAALAAFGLAGELAAAKAGGPGTFRSHLIDALAALDEETFARGQKVSIG